MCRYDAAHTSRKHAISRSSSNLITYPNNFMLQKAVLKLAKEKTKPEEPKTTSRIYTRRKNNPLKSRCIYIGFLLR
ncbi:hypothetical protein DZA51_01180 [Vibrio campbellii]|nr:hypothetical protein DZA51_01180 [Vibrio campbellii]